VVLWFLPYILYGSSVKQNKFLADFQVSILVWAFPLASQDQTRHENAKSNNDKAIQINKPYSYHTSMLGGAKGRHWHLLKKKIRLYIYGDNFYGLVKIWT